MSSAKKAWLTLGLLSLAACAQSTSSSGGGPSPLNQPTVTVEGVQMSSLTGEWIFVA